MIKRFKHIDFGIFKDFVWTGNLQDFKQKNIIYGWNYSGKTTLSRIFSFLNDKDIAEYPDLNFKIVSGEDRKEYSPINISDFEGVVKVFNSRFIQQNLKWDTHQSIDAIAFDIGENVTIRDEINKNLQQIDRIKGTEDLPGRIKKFTTDKESFLEFENGKISKEAKRIKNDVFNSLIEFSKRNFNIIVSELGSEYSKFQIKDSTELSTLKKDSLAINNKSKISPLTLKINYFDLRKEVISILNSEPSESEIIQELDDDKKKYQWGKDGLELHEESTETNCLFCGNEISSNRFDRLKRYFSNEAAVLKEKIKTCKQKIQNEKELLNTLFLPKSANDFSDSCIQEAKLLIDLFPYLIKNYNTTLASLVSELERKENDSLHESTELNWIDNISLIDLSKWQAQLNGLIAKHNDIVENFTSKQDEARDKIKKHYVSSFLITEDYYAIKEKHDYALRCISKYNCLVSKIEERNETLEASLKSITAGKERLNKYIEAFLNNDRICIEVTDDDKFQLKRDNKYAHNLSEGEKTAIAFAYFLVVLEGLHSANKLTETIVFIDDPISSLDANHIAQVYSLINSFFFRKGLDKNNPNKTINCFKQLFISTHNFEFFSFLKDSSKINRKNKVGDRMVPTCEYYQIKRVDNKKSLLLPLPKSLKSFKSEYVYLFDIIYKYHKSESQTNDENIFLLPNALRRFLEIYSLMKIPHTPNDLENRINELLGETHNFKILHHFSHFTTFEKLTRFDDLIMNLPLAATELIELLEKTDINHLISLRKAINMN